MRLVAESCNFSENCTWTTSSTQFRINAIGYRYCYPSIAAVGIVLSLLLLLTLRRACFHSADVYTYLRCLMVSDCAVLSMNGATLLDDSWQPTVVCADRSFLMRSRAEAVWRVAFLPLANSLIVLSMGIQLWMTLDRYLAVCAPRRRPARRRRHHLLLRVAGTLVLALALHAPLVFGYQVLQHCPAGHEFYELALSGSAERLGGVWNAYQWALQLLARWTPTGLLLYCNGYIIAAIRRCERRVSTTPRPAPRSAPDHRAGGGGPGSTGPPREEAKEEDREPRLSVVSGTRLETEGSQPPPPPTRRQEAGTRLELLLGAMGVSYLISNCLQMALFIVQYVYKQSDVDIQIFRAVANNYEALNFVLDSVLAMAFLPQVRRESVGRLIGLLG